MTSSSFRTEPALRRLALLVALLGAMGVVRAEAVELEYGFTGRTGYRSNLFLNVDEFAEGDFSFRLGPDVALRDRTGSLRWDLRYRVDYEVFTRFSDLNGFNHDFLADLDWDITERTTLHLENQFLRQRTPQALNEQVPTPGGSFVSERIFLDRPVTQNDFAVELAHRLSDRNRLEFAVRSAIWRNDDDLSVDSDVWIVSGAYNFQLTPPTSIGLGVDYTRQDFSRPGGFDSGTTFYNGFARLVHQFDPTLYFDIAAGPTRIQPDSVDQLIDLGEAQRIPLIPRAGGGSALIDVRSCPVLGDGTPTLSAECSPLSYPLFQQDLSAIERDLIGLSVMTDQQASASTTYFARASLVKQWRNWQASLLFSRDASLAGGAIGSTISNVFTASATWQPSRRWNLLLGFSYVLRESSSEPLALAETLGATTFSSSVGLPPATNVAQRTGLRTVSSDTEFEQQVYIGRASLSRDLNRWMTVSASAFYSHETRSGTQLIEDATIPAFSLFLSFTYRFEPVHFSGI